MGRQFQIYLLPSDTAKLVEMLRREVGVRLLASQSPNSRAIEGDLPIRTPDRPAPLRCLLAPQLSIPEEIKLDYIEKQGYWVVNTLFSDVVEFSECYFDETVLHRGRLFYDPGFYEAQRWHAKSSEFLNWAEKIFKTAKGSLKRIGSLDAYVGADAEQWHSSGGTFVETVIKGRPILAEQPAKA